MYVTLTISKGLYLTHLKSNYLIPSIIWYNEILHNAINCWYLNEIKRRTVRETQNDMLNTKNLPLLRFMGNHGERGSSKQYVVKIEYITLKFPQEFAEEEKI